MYVGGLFKRGAGVIKKNYVILIPLPATQLLSMIFSFPLFLGIITMRNSLGSSNPLIMTIFTVILSVIFVSQILAIGSTMTMTVEAVTSGKTSLKTGIQGIRTRIVDIILFSLGIFGTVIIGGIIVSITTITLILPGIIFIYLFFFVFPPLVIYNLSPIPALKKSYNLIKGNFFDVIILLVTIFLFMIVTLSIASIFRTIPVIGPIIQILVNSILFTYIFTILVLFYLEKTNDSAPVTDI